MEARAISGVMQVPQNKRAGVLRDGLDLLVEHVGELQAAGTVLRDAGNARGAAIVDVVRGEEAAKALILVDSVRLGWLDDRASSKHLRHFSDHVARGIYCEVTAMNPACFSEVRREVDRLRRSHYLDGPNDVDWTFRNQIESEREEVFYVDYVKYDDGHQWVSPRDRFERAPWSADAATRLLLAMNRLGMLTEAGLQLIERAWREVEMADDQKWHQHHDHVEIALTAISDAGLITASATQEDINAVYEHWTFPLGTLDLTKRRVPNSGIEKERARGMEQMMRDIYGMPDDDGW